MVGCSVWSLDVEQNNEHITVAASKQKGTLLQSLNHGIKIQVPLHSKKPCATGLVGKVVLEIPVPAVSHVREFG